MELGLLNLLPAPVGMRVVGLTCWSNDGEGFVTPSRGDVMRLRRGPLIMETTCAEPEHKKDPAGAPRAAYAGSEKGSIRNHLKEHGLVILVCAASYSWLMSFLKFSSGAAFNRHGRRTEGCDATCRPACRRDRGHRLPLDHRSNAPAQPAHPTRNPQAHVERPDQ